MEAVLKDKGEGWNIYGVILKGFSRRNPCADMRISLGMVRKEQY